MERGRIGLNWKCGIGMNAGREKVRVANALGDLPKISEAFQRGEISYSKVRAMTRVATPENEDYLLMIARHGTAHHVETLVSGYRRACRLNDREIAEKQFNTRSLAYRWDDDGSMVLNGRLPPEIGVILVKALESAIDAADRKDDVTAETWEPVSARRADALAEMAESYLQTGPAESSSADRYQVMIHVTAETLESGVTAVTSDAQHRHCEEGKARRNSPDHHLRHCEEDEVRRSNPGFKADNSSFIEDGPHVTADTSQRISCDCSISTLHEDESGEPLSIGRKSRVVPAPMRRALKARDKCCRFPGCTHRYFIDAHHVDHWADGGETSVGNLLLLCRFHHRLVHEGGFDCEKAGDGKIVFRDQEGMPIDPSGYSMPPVDDNVIIDLKQKLEERHIHSQSCVTKWQGEKMDRHLAVGHLWHLCETGNSD